MFTRYSPVRHYLWELEASFLLLRPFDLHVLGTPPAFVLSQDQTLRKNLIRLLAGFLLKSDRLAFNESCCSFWHVFHFHCSVFKDQTECLSSLDDKLYSTTWANSLSTLSCRHFLPGVVAQQELYYHGPEGLSIHFSTDTTQFMVVFPRLVLI